MAHLVANSRIQVLQLRHLLSSISGLCLELGEQALDVLRQLLVVGVDLLALAHEARAVLGRLELVDGIVVALVEGAAPVLQALDLLDEAGHAETRLARLILGDGEVEADVDDDEQEEAEVVAEIDKQLDVKDEQNKGTSVPVEETSGNANADELQVEILQLTSRVDDLRGQMEEFQGKIRRQVSIISTTLQIGLTV